MSEHESAPQNEDTPQDPTAPSEETAAEDHKVVDYRSRYENLLPEFTRKSQRLAELESQLQQGDDQYEDDDELEYAGGYEPDDIERLIDQKTEAALARRDRQQAEKDAEIAFVNAEITRIEKETGDEFSDEEWDYIGRTSEDLRREDGRPDVERAFEHFNAVIEGRKKKWYSGKKSARPASGADAAEVVDLDDSEARAKFIDDIMGQHVPD